MKIIVALLLTSLLYANPIENAYSWINQEYKDFRTYPRVNRAQLLLKEGKIEESKRLLQKSLKIDNKNQTAINLLLKICIQQKDSSCIKAYSTKVEDTQLGYFYKEKAEKEKKRKKYQSAIQLSKKALTYKLKKQDRYFIKLILFESYLKLNQYAKADTLIDRENLLPNQKMKWSKISNNLKETKYAYDLVKELPNRAEYIKWRVALLLEERAYTKASKQIEILDKIEPSEKNRKQLLYLYKLTGQNERIIKNYQQKLKAGCDKYALTFLLNNYKDNRAKKFSLLEKNYPYNCLNQKQRNQLSLELIGYLKDKKPRKAKQISKEISRELTNQKDLIWLYQNTGEKGKLLKLYKAKLNQGCNEYALNFLLDYYKKSKKRKKEILKKAYPYSCLTAKKQTIRSLELINLLDKKELTLKKRILSHLTPNSVNKKSTLYLSNLESSLGNYNKSISYAKSYLKHYPNSVEATKNIGYAYFKLGNKGLSIHYLMKASKLDLNDHNLLKNIGYLCIDLKEYTTATYYWSLYLTKKADAKIQLELASLYYRELHQKEKALKLLKQYEASTQKYTIEYYILKVKLSNSTDNCQESLGYYEKALEIEKPKYLRYEYIHLLQQCKEMSKATALMQEFANDYPNNLQYQKELAYMYSRNKNHQEAIKNFKKIKEREPNNIDNYTTLAYTYQHNGQKEKAIKTFKEAIDHSKNLYIEQRQKIKREITNSSKAFHFYLIESARLDAYKEINRVSPINSASYHGFGSMELSYKPTFLPKNTTLYGKVIHNHKNVKKSIQPSLGVRYKPVKDKKIYLSAEQLIKVGKASRDDTLLRASLGVSSKPSSTTHENLYLEGAYFIKEKSNILYGNYELGKVYKQKNGTKIIPYITTGATSSNDNSQKSSITKLDVGVGVAIDILSGETEYEIGKYRNRLKLEARQKYAGNSKEKQSLRLQWEFFY